MARLNQPPDPPYANTANNRTSNAVAASPPNMSSPQLRSLSLETSSRSQGSDNLPHLPPCRGSEQPSLSPADCRTLEKILRSVASPPATPSTLERSDQLSLDSGCASTANPPAKEDCYNLVGGEATDTGYEDEDDSMEISEGEAVVVAQSTVTSLDDHASPSISKSDRRLQDSVSAHDQNDKLRYSGGRCSSATKRAKSKRTDHERGPSIDVTEGDTIEDILNNPGKRVAPARPLIFHRSDFDRHTVSDDIEQLNRMRLSMEKVLDQEGRVEFGAEPDVSISSLSGLQHQAEDFEESELDGFDADIEETQSKISIGRKISQGNASRIERQTLPVATVEKAGDSAILVPSTPARTPEPARFQFTTNQSVPETPFTKTLSYFKQYKGAENSLAKRRRNTALPEELVEVTEDVADTEVKIDDPKEHDTQPEDGNACILKVTSALVDLEFMAQPDDNIDGAIAAPPHRQEDRETQISAVIDGASEQIRTVSDSEAVDANKQIVLYPQHPAFVNAIGMIPATMFWVTAAPIARYTSIAVELLIDKLRDTYL